ncbi:hypothetical protein GY45DRAFT_939663 [Cubamyces sp. BRFM 1775]|nr:hypothetical protein GY45DRAFT_939663 [Cubamyces sp. BRFM 1775]
MAKKVSAVYSELSRWAFVVVILAHGLIIVIIMHCSHIIHLPVSFTPHPHSSHIVPVPTRFPHLSKIRHALRSRTVSSASCIIAFTAIVPPLPSYVSHVSSSKLVGYVAPPIRLSCHRSSTVPPTLSPSRSHRCRSLSICHLVIHCISGAAVQVHGRVRS